MKIEISQKTKDIHLFVLYLTNIYQTWRGGAYTELCMVTIPLMTAHRLFFRNLGMNGRHRAIKSPYGPATFHMCWKTSRREDLSRLGNGEISGSYNG